MDNKFSNFPTRKQEKIETRNLQAGSRSLYTRLTDDNCEREHDLLLRLYTLYSRFTEI